MKYLDIIDSNFQKAESQMGTIHAKAVAFDSPGCKPMLSEMKDKFDVRYEGRSSSVKALDITTYLSAPNLVNTCNAHVGTLFRIEMNYSAMTLFEKYTLLYTNAAHAMQEIVDSLHTNNNPTIIANVVADWPQISFYKYLTRPIRKCWQYTLLPFKIMLHYASKLLVPKDYQIHMTLQDEEEDEWVNFFRWARNDNYNPATESDEFQDKLQKSFGYWPIRYQTNKSDNRCCNINVFTLLEQQFITTYFNLRTIRGTFQGDNSLADVLDSADQDMIRHNLSDFEIDDNHIICDNLNLFIPYVQQLLHWHKPIIDATKAQISDYMSRKQWYDKENLRFLKSLQSLHLHFRENIWMELNMEYKVCQVIVEQSEDMRTMTAKIYYYCVNNGMVEADCTVVLKLKQLLFIDQQYVNLSSYLGSNEMTRHLFIIECQHSSSSLEPACKLLGSIFSELERKQEVRLIFITKFSDENLI